MAERLLTTIDNLLWPVCVAIVALFAALLAVQVALRYAFDMPLFWVEELCRFLLVYLTFLGAALAWGRREHISIDIMKDILASRQRPYLQLVVDLAVLGFAAWATVAGLEYSIYSMNRTSVALGVPMGLGYLGVPIGFICIVIQTAVFIFQNFANARHAGSEFGG